MCSFSEYPDFPISTKCGLDRTGVWAAWGKVCLAAGSWEDARIKFSHCLKSSPKPARNPPLVNEICHILESATSFPNVKIQQKLPEKGQVVAQEIAQILSTLKHISQGKSLPLSAISAKNSVHYEEEIYYLATYGSHQALLSFYFKQDELKNALNYLLQMQLEPDLFYECLLLPSYRSDQHEKFKSSLLSVDSSLDSFKKYLSHSCTILQKIGYLNTLYDLQVLMKDYVRAAVTCIHLYQKSAANFTELVSRSSHLHTALRHLEEELGAIMKKTKRLDCIMQMDPKTINRHMNTIWRQLEAAKFLSACESQDKFTVKDIFPDEVTEECELPTLFDGNPQRIILVKMIVLLGKNIAEGFGVAFRIIQDHHLDLHAICIGLGKKLAENGRTSDIPALVDCLKTSGVADVNPLIDKTISVSIPILKQNEVPLTELEPLAKLIKNVELRVNAFIDTQQLVSAYILAVNSNRLNDIERIMQVAEQTGQESIKKICKSKLDQSIESGSARPSTK
ncbi:hypothetical protein RUM43_007034 [Polyplax serrata]|uniref:ZFYVE26-like TPR repeats domain-containing protein n=1 Tax=Polyplax serrata TaxID=468196 RepID=A0AAN8PM41_POLSC